MYVILHYASVLNGRTWAGFLSRSTSPSNNIILMQLGFLDVDLQYMWF